MMITNGEKIIIKLICRLFWLITQISGVARYSSDVKTFVEAEIEIGSTTEKVGRKLIDDYIKDERR